MSLHLCKFFWRLIRFNVSIFSRYIIFRRFRSVSSCFLNDRSKPISVVRSYAKLVRYRKQVKMVKAWFMDSSDEDQRLAHQLDPPQPVSLEDLENCGVLYWKVSRSDHAN